MQLIGYTDVNWGGDPNQRKSPYGYVFLLNDCAISWCSKKQSCITLSMMEAEYVACSSAIQKVVWLKIAFKHVTLHCDNMTALAYAKNPKYLGKTKHI